MHTSIVRLNVPSIPVKPFRKMVIHRFVGHVVDSEEQVMKEMEIDILHSRIRLGVVWKGI